MTDFIHQPITIQGMTLPTRLVMPPMATEAGEHGLVSEGLIDYYVARAQNEHVGLIITEHQYVDKRGKASPKQLSIADDEAIFGLRRLTAAVHRAKPGIKIISQINHCGRQSHGTGEMALVGPMAETVDGRQVEALSREDIASLVEAYAQGARRAKEAGYDGVEIHSAHGYLLNQFYSPLSNKRTDEYGPQTMENRLRFHREVIEAVKAQVGASYPVALRLGGVDYTEGGSTVNDAVEAAQLLESYGIHLLDLSGGLTFYTRKDCHEPGWFADMSTPVKEAVSIPVILTGGVQTLAQAETLLQAQAADLIGVGRALLKDAHWEM